MVKWSYLEAMKGSCSLQKFTTVDPLLVLKVSKNHLENLSSPYY